MCHILRNINLFTFNILKSFSALSKLPVSFAGSVKKPPYPPEDPPGHQKSDVGSANFPNDDLDLIRSWRRAPKFQRNHRVRNSGPF